MSLLPTASQPTMRETDPHASGGVLLPSVGAVLGEPPCSNPLDTPISAASVGGKAQAPAAPGMGPPFPAVPAAPAATTQAPAAPDMGAAPAATAQDHQPLHQSTHTCTTPHSTPSIAIPTRRVPVSERWTYVPPTDEAPKTESAMHTSTAPLNAPKTIHQAQLSPEWPQWSDTCKSELKSMHNLNTHQLDLKTWSTRTGFGSSTRHYMA